MSQYKVRRGIRFGSLRAFGGRFYACRMPALGEYHLRLIVLGREVSLRLIVKKPDENTPC